MQLSEAIDMENQSARARVTWVIWRRNGSLDRWEAVELPEEGLALSHGAGGEFGGASEHVSALILPFEEGGARRLALVTSQHSGGAVLRNGEPVLGVVALDHEVDELVVSGETLYISARGLLTNVPFPAGGGEIRCSRCKSVMRAGDRAVRCPCELWFHEGALAVSEQSRECFSYSDMCVCGRPRDELAWSPGQEEDDARGC